MTDNVAKCLLISKVLVADGMMTDDERAFLDDLKAAMPVYPITDNTAELVGRISGE